MRIVVGVDGSPSSLTALELVENTIWPGETTIRLVSAFEPPLDWTAAAPAASSGTTGGDETERDLFNNLLDMARPLSRSGYAAETVVARGRAADVLLAEADDLHADLIIVGSRGLGVAATALLGSVSAALVDHASCPVLVARGPRVSRILLATDGSQSAEAIPAVLLAWNVFRDVPVEVLSVAPTSIARERAILLSGMVGSDALPPDAWHEIERHRVMADEMARRLMASGRQAQGVVRRGEAAPQIEAAAANLGADLIITGSRGLSGLRRLLMGSVAHHVLLHSPLSVLVMRGHVSAVQPRAVQLPSAAAPG
jgi:nucleotide-binding universal stress UspA family protein